MKTFIASLKSLTPYSQGKYHNTPKEPRELEQAYEERCCLLKLHVSLGEIYIPPMAFKKCLENTAGYLGEQIPGKGKERYTKHYRQGLMCTEPMLLGIGPQDVRIEKIFTSTQPGKKNSGRAWKWFPVINQWAGNLQIIAVDDIFTRDVIERHLSMAGVINGVGVWRPENGGMWGKFQLVKLEETTL